jgi:tetratricopeptide (TPR) repeat protein
VYTGVAIGAGTLAALLIALIALAAVRSERVERQHAERRVWMNEQFRPRDAAEREAGLMFGGPGADEPLVFAELVKPAADEAAEFAALFDALGEALQRGDAGAVQAAFDTARVLAELDRIDAFAKLPGNQAPGFRDGVRAALEAKLGEGLAGNELARWSKTDVRHVRWSDDRRAAVVIAVHHRDAADDVPTRVRWWLARRPDGWKVYDFEDLHLGMRFTRMSAAMMTPAFAARIGRDPGAVQAAVGGLRQALVHLSRGETVAADVALAGARGGEWPPPIQALLELAEGVLLTQREEPAKALERFDAVEKLTPDAPGLLLARGAAYVALGRHDDALAAVRAYQKEVGPDALSFTLEGHALERQDKLSAAAASFRKALDEVPNGPDAFDGLRRVLTDARKGELGDRLAKLADPTTAYGTLVALARADGDDVAADVLLDTLLKVRPDDPRALGDDVRRKVKAQKLEAAAAALKRGLGLADPADRESVLDAYLYAMLEAGKALAAYDVVPAAHARAAFRTLAEELGNDLDKPGDAAAEAKRLRQLTGLVAVHRGREPNDPWAWFYEAAIYSQQKEYEKAEGLLAAGAAKLPKAAPDDLDAVHAADRFREQRVECLFKLKRGADAYRDVGPPEATFAQLAGLYDRAGDFAALAELLAMHRKRVPDDVEWVYWQAHLHFRKDNLAAAVPLFKSYLRDAGEGASRGLARDELLRALLRTRPAEARRTLNEFGPDTVSQALRAAIAAATDDRPELERLLAESARGGKTWFYSDADFRRAVAGDAYRDLRAKYPDPNPPPKADG